MPVVESEATDSALPERLRNWLEEQGYPLEMNVAASMRKVGARVIQSDYYEDPGEARHQSSRYRRQSVVDQNTFRFTCSC